jgi:hypothetical protein
MGMRITSIAEVHPVKFGSHNPVVSEEKIEVYRRRTSSDDNNSRDVFGQVS